jgi:HAD superfamily hydrolase (TIGR01484 family)
MMAAQTMSREMAPIADLSDAVCRNLIGVMTDIDDTITTDGQLSADAYAMLERLSEAGLLVVPITGRPAGWCDMIARFWPVAGIVGENGALAMRYDRQDRKMHRTLNMDGRLREQNRAKLDALAEKILADVPGAALASDQQYREADLAIDFCEDVTPLPEEDIDRIVSHFKAVGAVAKVSSIHVNGWFGDWDKLTMSKRFLSESFGIDLENQKDRFVFCGDSPNDAPMFGYFPYSCGVANVADFLGRMDALPRYIAPSHGGAGFVEIGEHILQAREGLKAGN